MPALDQGKEKKRAHQTRQNSRDHGGGGTVAAKQSAAEHEGQGEGPGRVGGSIVKEDLGCKSYTRPKRHLVSPGAKSRCHKSYISLYSKDAGGGRVVISEERGLASF